MLHLVERSSGIIDSTLGSTELSAPDMGLDRLDAISDQWDQGLGKGFVFSFVYLIVYSRPKPRPAVLLGKPQRGWATLRSQRGDAYVRRPPPTALPRVAAAASGVGSGAGASPGRQPVGATLR